MVRELNNNLWITTDKSAFSNELPTTLQLQADWAKIFAWFNFYFIFKSLQKLYMKWTRAQKNGYNMKLNQVSKSCIDCSFVVHLLFEFSVCIFCNNFSCHLMLCGTYRQRPQQYTSHLWCSGTTIAEKLIMIYIADKSAAMLLEFCG